MKAKGRPSRILLLWTSFVLRIACVQVVPLYPLTMQCLLLVSKEIDRYHFHRVRNPKCSNLARCSLLSKGKRKSPMYITKALAMNTPSRARAMNVPSRERTRDGTLPCATRHLLCTCATSSTLGIVVIR